MYNNRNKLVFSEIPETYAVDKRIRGRVSEMHSAIVTHVTQFYHNTNKYRQTVVNALNAITYFLLEDEFIPDSWRANNLLGTIPDLDLDSVKERLGPYYLTPEAIEWDVVDSNEVYSAAESLAALTNSEVPAQLNNSTSSKFNTVNTLPVPQASLKQIEPEPKVEEPVEVQRRPGPVAIQPTPKGDLYLAPPVFPQFDFSKPWLAGRDRGTELVIYTTLPEIPTKQNEISVTTNVAAMTETELTLLYPNVIIKTRAPIMYEPCEGIELHPDLGLILPIQGYTREQLIANLIQYPHFYKLTRHMNNTFTSFYADIELEGQLHSTLDVWDSLPESSIIPKTSEFIKEYVVRRYLLERDYKHIDHQYPIFGTLEPFLTLFMPIEDYIRLGYSDVVKLARDCVTSRVRYKQSRNPVIRRLQGNA